MSKVQLQGNVSGTGVFTIASPNSNTDRTLTLPDSSGTIGLSGAAVTRSQMPSGSIVQVAQAVKGDTQTIQSSSWTDVAGLSVSITPQSSSSRILVMATLNYSYTESWNSGSMRLYRGSTPIFVGDTAALRTSVTTTLAYQTVEPQNELMFTRTVQFVDSPSSTSSLTYKVAVADFDDGGGPIFINRCRNDSTAVGRTASSIIVMEIV